MSLVDLLFGSFYALCALAAACFLGNRYGAVAGMVFLDSSRISGATHRNREVWSFRPSVERTVEA